MSRLLLISCDAVGDGVFPRLAGRPHFTALLARSALARGVKSLFLTNTYPVHTSIVTGVPQAVHGLINNTEPFPKRHPRWNTAARLICSETLWQAAALRGLSTAAVMWPATGGAREIRWNIPELMVLPGQSQVLENLKAGSKWLQLRGYLRHRRLLRGIAQPERDRFATACMADILRAKRPHLALMHLTAFDSLCHEHGVDAPILETALDALDENLGTLLAAAGDGYEVLVFSDHAQLPAQRAMLPNELLVEAGLLEKDAGGDYILNPEGNCYFECCGGSAFFHPWHLEAEAVEAVRRRAEALEGFDRFLTDEELAVCGRGGLPFGLAAKPGWALEAFDTGEMANHGYPADYPDYNVFFFAAGSHFKAGARAEGGDLLDVAPLAAEVLGLELPDIRAPRRELLA